MTDFINIYQKNQKTTPQTPNYQNHYTPQTNNSNFKMKTCPVCSGSGTKVCSSCGGMGGRYQSRVDYDWQGNPQYRDEWINCYSCSGGYSNCTNCYGKRRSFYIKT